MFLPVRDGKATEKLTEFGRPVESIMRCEDFKSNFARRLSNRYVARSPAASQKLKPDLLKTAEKPEQIVIAPERIELCSQLSKSIKEEQHRESKTPDKSTEKNDQIKATEVTALNREVELLKWQLAQTEANRQMQIALLKQIVSFLNRVKGHMESQNKQDEPRKPATSRLYASSFNTADLPRSKSVLNVKLLDYPSAKHMRKISKSICNEDGFTDNNIFLNQSKLSLNQETDSKITEEISRLITLANSVLSTKVPDLLCTCDKTKSDSDDLTPNSPSAATCTDITTRSQNKSALQGSLDLIEEAITLSYAESNEPNETLTNSSNRVEDSNVVNIKIEQQPSSPNTKNITDLSNGKACKREIDFNVGANFIEDESGFSSMNSFQEIGIPIINIIPPTPCKSAATNGFPRSDFNIFDASDDLLSLNETGKWNVESIEIDKQAMKVFWV